MGRSKFPGKPSKSINRKRISVLQLDDETTTTTQTTAATTTVISNNSTTTTTQTTSATSLEKHAENEANESDTQRHDNNKKLLAAAAATTSSNRNGSSSKEKAEPPTDTTAKTTTTTTTTTKRKNDTSGVHCADNNGTNIQTRHNDDDDDDSDVDVNHRTLTAAVGNDSIRNGNGNSSNSRSAANNAAAAGAGAGANGVGDKGNIKSVNAKNIGNVVKSGIIKETRENHNNTKVQNNDAVEQQLILFENNDDKKNVLNTAEECTLDIPVKVLAVDNNEKQQQQQQQHVNDEQSEEDEEDDEDEDVDVEEFTNDLLFPAKHAALTTFSKKSPVSAYAGAFSPTSSSHSSSNSSTNSFTMGRSKIHLVRDVKRKKFANLNLDKAEIMLPSSSKLKLNEQHNATTTTTATTTTAALINTTEDKKSNTTTTTTIAHTTDNINNESLQNNADELSVNLTKIENKLMTNPTMLSPTTTTTTATATTTNNNMCLSPSTKTNTNRQKKTVTFKSIPETSDDRTAVKKIYNPDNRLPLISIIKKEAMARHRLYSRNNATIVRPSRLTEIVKNNANIDKLNALKFRSTSITSGAGFCNNMTNVFAASRTDEKLKFATKSDIETDVITTSQVVEEEEDDDEEEQQQHVDNDDEEEEQMIVDKHFVLPKRSTRSLRIIKPNKRLLEDGIISQKKCTQVKKEQQTQQKPQFDTQPKQNLNNLKGSTNYFSLSNLAKDSALTFSPPTTVEQKLSTFSLSTTTLPSSFGSLSSNLKGNNFVLRQPRLQVDSFVESSTVATDATKNTFGVNGILGGNLKTTFALSSTSKEPILGTSLLNMCK